MISIIIVNQDEQKGRAAKPFFPLTFTHMDYPDLVRPLACLPILQWKIGLQFITMPVLMDGLNICTCMLHTWLILHEYRFFFFR